VLERLRDLQEDWNSHGARQVSADAVAESIALLRDIVTDDLPEPAVVPTVDGGVQFEWHEQGIDLEIAVAPGGRGRAFFAEDASGEEWEEEFSVPPARLRRSLASLVGHRLS
jgi:hypothetical protein